MKNYFLLLFGLVFLGIASAWAETVTFSMPELGVGIANGTDVGTLSIEPVSIKFSAGTHINSLPPRWYATGKEIRMYAGNTMTFEVGPEYWITKVEFTSTGSSYNLSAIANAGSYESNVWTAFKNETVRSLEIQNSSTNQARFSQIVVTYEGKKPNLIEVDALSVTPVELEVGDEGKFAVTGPEGFLDDVALTFSQSTSNAVEVDSEGNYKAVGVGAVDITISWSAGSVYAAGEYTLTVTAKAPKIKVESLSVTPLELEVGNEGKFAVNGPDGFLEDVALTFSQSTANAVEVDGEGNYKAVGVGSVDITVSWSAGSVYAAGEYTFTVVSYNPRTEVDPYIYHYGPGDIEEYWEDYLICGPWDFFDGIGEYTITSDNENVLMVELTDYYGYGVSPIRYIAGEAGTATITIEWTAGEKYLGGKKSFDVNVMANPSIFKYQGVLYEVLDSDEGTCQTVDCGELYFDPGPRQHVTESYLVLPAVVYNGDTPYTLTRIGEYGFKGDHNIESVILPNTVTSIGRGAFLWSSLHNIDMPSSVHTIEREAFSNCELNSVHIPESVSYIGDNAFEYCSTSGGNISYQPASVRYIGSRAFENCQFESGFVIPETVGEIADYAFSGCRFDEYYPIYYFTNEPVAFSENIFDDYTYENTPLCVALGAIDVMKATTPWGKFVHIYEYEPAAFGVKYDEDCGDVIYNGSILQSESRRKFSDIPDGILSLIIVPHKGYCLDTIELSGDSPSDETRNLSITPNNNDDPYDFQISKADLWAISYIRVLDIRFRKIGEATLTVSSPGHHTVTHTCSEGSDITVTLEPQEGWALHSVTLNDQPIEFDSDNKISIPAISGQNTLNAIYEVENPLVKIEDVSLGNAAPVSITLKGHLLKVYNKPADVAVMVYNLSGQLVAQTMADELDIPLRDEVAIIKVGGKVFKVVVK